MSILDESVLDLISLDDEEKYEVYKQQGDIVEFESQSTVDRLIFENVESHPDDTAVVFGEEKLSFSNFWRLVCKIEYGIRKKTNKNGLVAIAMMPCIERLAAVVAVLKSVNGFMPIDMDNPKDRVKWQLEDSGSKLLIADSANSDKLDGLDINFLWVDKLSENTFEEKPASDRSSTDVAYVIYTSGSTGLPKGCAISHMSLLNRLAWMAKDVEISSDDNICHKTSFGFDVSVWEQLLGLVYGAATVIVPDNDRKDTFKLAHLMAEKGVTITHFVPTMLSTFLDDDYVKNITTLKQIICSGEALPLTLACKCEEVFPQARLKNYYGPTEATIDVTAWSFNKCDDFPFVPIGRPIDNVTAYVLLDDLSMAPLGTEGELYIGGVAVAEGYINRPSLTAERFIPDPYSNAEGARLYKTGDVVIRHEGGVIEYVGRSDFQVKVKGYRIELGEVEEQLRKLDIVTNTVVVVDDEKLNLVAYITGAEEIDIEVLKTEIEKRVPKYMVPKYWVLLDSLPTNSNGKVDRKALPSYRTQLINPKNLVTPPSTNEELLVLSIWKTLLKIEVNDVNLDFFALGGDSILAIKMATALRKEGYILEVKDVFDYPTVKQLSQRISKKSSKEEMPVPELSKIWRGNTLISDIVSTVYEVEADSINGVIRKLEEIFQLLVNTGLAGNKSGNEWKLIEAIEKTSSISSQVNSGLESTSGWLCADGTNDLFAAYILEVNHGRFQVVISFSPEVVDWVSVFHLSAILEKDFQQYQEESISYRDLAMEMAKYPTIPKSFYKDGRVFEKRTKVGVAESSTIRFSLPETLHMRVDPMAGCDDILSDVISVCVINSLKSIGIDELFIELPESRAFASQCGYETSRVFGRISNVVSGNLDIKDADVRTIRKIRHGEIDLPQLHKPNSVRCKIVYLPGYVPQSQENTSLRLSNDYYESMAQSLIGDYDLLVYCVAENETLLVHMHSHRSEMLSLSSIESEVEHSWLKMLDERCIWNTRVSSDYPLVEEYSEITISQVDKAPLDIYPLSPTQEGMLLRSLYWAESDAYHNQNVIELIGPIDEMLLIQAWNQVVRRYEILRAGYLWDSGDTFLQYIAYEPTNKPQLLDWTNIDSDKIDEHIDLFLDEDRAQRLDLNQAGLWRFYLAKNEEKRHFVIWSHHHILLDGWCLSLIWGDVFKLYDALTRGEGLQKLTQRPYKDYIAWLKYKVDNLNSNEYWENYLNGFEEPTNFSEFGADVEGEFDTWRIALTEDETEKVNSFARSISVTSNAVIQSAWSILLSLRSGSNDVVHGVSVSGRPPQLSGSEDIVGLFINTVPLRLKYDGKTDVVSYIKETQSILAEATRHAQMPLSEITSKWRGRKKSDDRIFDSLIAFENYPEDNLPDEQMGEITIIDRFCNEKTEYPIGLIVLPGTKMELHFNFDKSHFSKVEMEGFVEIYKSIIFSFTDYSKSKIAELPYLRNTLSEGLGKNIINPVDQDSLTLNQNIFNYEDGRDTAIVDEKGTVWSYANLKEEVSCLSGKLQSLGISTGSIVAVEQGRSVYFVSLFLSLINIDAVPVIINPLHSDQAKIRCIEKSKANFLITNSSYGSETVFYGAKILTKSSIDSVDVIERDFIQTLPSGKFILSTSGTSGDPKLVICRESGLVDRIFSTSRKYDFSRNDRLLANASVGFDILLWEMFFPLVNGGVLVIAPEGSTLDPKLLENLINENGVTAVHLIPSVLKYLIEFSSELCSLSTVITGGEVVSPTLVHDFYEKFPSMRLWQGYGPTEASVSVTDHLCFFDDGKKIKVPIGTSSNGTEILILDKFLRPVPVNVEGDIFIAGSSLALGYLDDPINTASSFVPSPISNRADVIYKTGDRGKWNLEGEVEFAGRNDRLIKIRGQRVDLDSIELLLASHNYVDTAIVEFVECNDSGTLAAFIVLNDKGVKNEQHAVAEINIWLSPRVGEVVQFSNMKVMSELPLTINGKVDRQALMKTLEVSENDIEPEDVESFSGLELVVAKAWKEITGRTPRSRFDNFFDAGGHSLMAIQLVREIRKNLSDDLIVEVSHVFKFPTISGISEAIVSVSNSEKNEHIIELGEYRNLDKPPLVLIHPVEGMSHCYDGLENYIRDRKVFAFSNPRLMAKHKFTSLKEMASLYVEWARTLIDDGPIILGGWSFGGVVALEMARQMAKHGGEVKKLIMIDSFNLSEVRRESVLDAKTENLEDDIIQSEIMTNTMLAFAHEFDTYKNEVNLIVANETYETKTNLVVNCGWSDEVLPNLIVSRVEGEHHQLFESSNKDLIFSEMLRVIES